MRPNLFYYLVLTFLILLFTGCNSERKNWKNTKQKNTIQAYENFIAIHPKSIFADSAKIFIEKYHFNQAKTINTVLAYEEFLKLYPQSVFADSIHFFIEDIYFNQAESTNTITTYENFLEQFPQGSLAMQARALIDKLIPREPTIKEIKIISSSSDGSNYKVSFISTVIHKAGVISPSDKPNIGVILNHENGEVIGMAAVKKIEQKSSNTSLLHADFKYQVPFGMRISFSGKCKMMVNVYDKDGNESKKKEAIVYFK